MRAPHAVMTLPLIIRTLGAEWAGGVRGNDGRSEVSSGREGGSKEGHGTCLGRMLVAVIPGAEHLYIVYQVSAMLSVTGVLATRSPARRMQVSRWGALSIRYA